MLVSIVINNYNYGRFLSEAIDSALAQTYPNCEVIVVDDGSTDDSRRIIESYGHRILPIFKKNGGQASAFNAGWRQSKGDLIHFLDADDILYPHTEDLVISEWSPELSKIHFRLGIIDANGMLRGEFPQRENKLAEGECLATFLNLGTGSCVPTSGNVFSKRALDRFFPLDERFRVCADGLLFYLSAAFGPIKRIDRCLGGYRMHGDNSFAGGGWITCRPTLLRSRAHGAFARIRALEILTTMGIIREPKAAKVMTYRVAKDLLACRILRESVQPFDDLLGSYSTGMLIKRSFFGLLSARISIREKSMRLMDLMLFMILAPRARQKWLHFRDSLRR